MGITVQWLRPLLASHDERLPLNLTFKNNLIKSIVRLPLQKTSIDVEIGNLSQSMGRKGCRYFRLCANHYKRLSHKCFLLFP